MKKFIDTVGAGPVSAQKGITLIALIITIIVMLVLVAVTLTIALGDNGIINNAKEASMQTEEQVIYEKIVGTMQIKNGKIDVNRTYSETKTLLIGEGKVVTPVSPTAEDQITDGIEIVILDVEGEFGKYTYTITKEKIIIGRGEEHLTISGGTSYPAKFRIEPKAENIFTEDEASAIAAGSLGYTVNSFEEWVFTMASTTPGTSYTDYEDVIADFSNQYPEVDLTSHEKVFLFMMQMLGEEYTKYNNVYEFALDVYEAEEKKLMVNGEEATTGVTWDGNTAIYSTTEENYELKLVLDGKSANTVKISVDGYEGDLEAFGHIFIGKNFNKLSQIDENIYTSYGIDINKMKKLRMSDF